MSPLNSIDEILDDIRQGRMVVIMDDEDRENEGDL
ncbi:MAG: 3,4-dihydroxy-2-butanone-4-phosphate synthase, partial [Steroidobacteraceae bacterium]